MPVQQLRDRLVPSFRAEQQGLVKCHRNADGAQRDVHISPPFRAPADQSGENVSQGTEPRALCDQRDAANENLSPRREWKGHTRDSINE